MTCLYRVYISSYLVGKLLTLARYPACYLSKARKSLYLNVANISQYTAGLSASGGGHDFSTYYLSFAPPTFSQFDTFVQHSH